MKARNWVILGVILVAVGAAGYGVFLWPSQQAKAALDQVIAAAAPDWKIAYQRSHYDLLAREMTLDGVTVAYRDGSPTRIERTVLSGTEGAGTAADPFKARTIHATGIAAGSPAGYAIADATLSDVTMRADDLRASGTAAPGPTLARQLQAVRIGHADLKDIHGTGGASFRHIAFDSVAEARIARIVAEGLNDPSTHFTTDRVTATDVDVGGLVAVFDPAAYADAAPADGTPANGAPTGAPKVLIGAVEWSGAAAADTDTKTTIARMTLSNFAGRPFVVPPDAAHAKDPRLTDDIAAALRLDGATIEGLDVTPNDGGHVTVGRIALDGYADAGFKDFRIETTKVSVPGKADGGLDLFEIKGVALGKLSALMRRDEGGAARFGEWRNTVRVPSFTMTNLTATIPPGQTVSVAAIHSETEYENDVAKHTRQSIDAIHVPLKGWPADAGTQAALDAFGMDAVTMDIVADGGLTGDELDLNSMTFDLRDLGKLTLSVRLGGIDREMLARAALNPAEALLRSQGTFIGAHARYEDASLTDRLLRVAAAQGGGTADTVRASTAAQMEHSAVLREPAKQAAAFLRHPRAIDATATPPAPVPLANLGGLTPDQVAAKVGLVVKAQ